MATKSTPDGVHERRALRHETALRAPSTQSSRSLPGFTTWELVQGSSVVRNLHFVAPLSAALANSDDTLITAGLLHLLTSGHSLGRLPHGTVLAYYTSSQVGLLTLLFLRPPLCTPPQSVRVSVPSLHRRCPSNSSTLFLKSSEAKQPQVPVHVRALVLLGLHGVESCLSLPRRLCCPDQAAGVSLVRGQQLRGGLLVCALLLIMMRSHWCVPPLAPGRAARSGCPAAAAPGLRCCWTPAACSSPPSSSSGRDRPRSRRCWSR